MPTERIPQTDSFDPMSAAYPCRRPRAQPAGIFIVLLAVLLVCAQLAALLHEIGHGLRHDAGNPTVSTAAAESQDSGPASRGAYCDKCFQFAHVASAAAGILPAFFLVAATSEAAHRQPAAALAAEVPQTRSRGPPIVL
jgi:hypothetical protein